MGCFWTMRRCWTRTYLSPASVSLTDTAQFGRERRARPCPWPLFVSVSPVALPFVLPFFPPGCSSFQSSSGGRLTSGQQHHKWDGRQAGSGRRWQWWGHTGMGRNGSSLNPSPCGAPTLCYTRSRTPRGGSERLGPQQRGRIHRGRPCTHPWGWNLEVGERDCGSA